MQKNREKTLMEKDENSLFIQLILKKLLAIWLCDYSFNWWADNRIAFENYISETDVLFRSDF